MEHIFYAALALHIAGKPVNKKNIISLLQAAVTPVNEAALDALEAFVESLETAPREKAGPVDPRIVQFLTTELEKYSLRRIELEKLVQELNISTNEIERYESKQGENSGDGGAGEQTPFPTRLRRAGVPAQSNLTGVYIYGVGSGGSAITLGRVGIDDSEVYTIPYRDINAIVHLCPPVPYRSVDGEQVKKWVQTHQRVLDIAREYCHTIVPMGFDAIITPAEGANPEEAVMRWLQQEYERFRAIMEMIAGKNEYSVQVSYDREVLTRLVSEKDQEVIKLREEISSRSPGMAYISRQRFEKRIKEEVENFADEWFTTVYQQITECCHDVLIEKTRKVDNQKMMLLNLSCLVAEDRVAHLGEVLEKINNMDGFSVHFSGPWPPYSFVTKFIPASSHHAKN